MPFLPPEAIERARQMDLLTYLQTFEPSELVHIGGNHYCTREHDSLKISNGKWYWFSRGLCGYNALDNLVKVKDVPFVEAVKRISGVATYTPPITARTEKAQKPKALLLPKASRCATHAFNYLRSRGIEPELIDYCFQTGRIYESLPYHNVIFVGLDRHNKPRYASLRGIGTDFIGEASGSDKRFSFSIPAQNSDELHLFESAIDLLSFATLVKQNGGNWQQDHLVSLAGVYKPKENLQESSLPLTLARYLSEYPNIKRTTLRLGNDKAGGYMAKALVALLSDKYEVSVQPPPSGKDYNDYLCIKKGIPIMKRNSKAHEQWSIFHKLFFISLIQRSLLDICSHIIGADTDI